MPTDKKPESPTAKDAAKAPDAGKATDPKRPFVQVVAPDKTGDPALDRATGADALPGHRDAPAPDDEAAPGVNPAPLPKLKAAKASEREALVTLLYILRDNLSGDHPQARDRIDLLLEALGVDEDETQQVHAAMRDRAAASIERLAKRAQEDAALGVT